MIWLVLYFVVLTFGAGAILGAPYLPILRRDSERMLDISGLKSGERLIDLGSGDGRLLKTAARRGIRGIGYEINPILYAVSLIVTWPERKLVTIHLANYWQIPLPPAEVIYVFLLDRHMMRLAAKLKSECDPDTQLVSYIFKVPEAEPIRSNSNAFVYRVGDLEELPVKS